MFAPDNTRLAMMPLSDQKIQLLEQFFAIFRKQKGAELFNFRIDGSDLIQPVSVDDVSACVDDTSETNEEIDSTEITSSLE